MLWWYHFITGLFLWASFCALVCISIILDVKTVVQIALGVIVFSLLWPGLVGLAIILMILEALGVLD